MTHNKIFSQLSLLRLIQKCFFLFSAFAMQAATLPEPGLVMYGVVRNTANSNAQIISGTLTWTLTPASGSPVTVTTPLTDISGRPGSVAADVRRLNSVSDLRFTIADLKHAPRCLGYSKERSFGA